MINEIQKYLAKYITKCEKNIVDIEEKIKVISTLNVLSKEDVEILIIKQEKEIVSLKNKIRYATELSKNNELVQAFEHAYEDDYTEKTLLRNEHIFIIVYAYIKNRIFLELKVGSKYFHDKKGLRASIQNAYTTVEPFLLTPAYSIPQSTTQIKKDLYESLVNVGYSDYQSKEIIQKLFKTEDTKQLQKPTGAKLPTDTQNIRVYVDGKVLAKTKLKHSL